MDILESLKRLRLEWLNFTSVIIAGMGFFTDGYNLFCVAFVTRLLGRINYHHHGSSTPGKMPADIEAVMNSIAFFGMLVGQIFFCYVGSKLKRKYICISTMVLMIASALMSSLSFGSTQKAVIGSVIFFRFWLGIGIGGDFPLSASIMSESFNRRTRGGFMAAIFAMQGMGILASSTVAIIVSAGFQAIYNPPSFDTSPDLSTPPEADFAWRIILALGAVPAAFTLYFRMKMPDLPVYSAILHLPPVQSAEDLKKQALTTSVVIEKGNVKVQKAKVTKINSKEFVTKYGFKLFACASTRFLLALVFYCLILYQKDIFETVGWLDDPRTTSAFQEILGIGRTQAIIAIAAVVPGYWLTAATIDCLGRYTIQLVGFFFMTVFSVILVSAFDCLATKPSRALFLILFGLLLFFANFGPNVTSFIFPAELFPGHLRVQCHAVTTAAGKVGAIMGIFAFLAYTQKKERNRHDQRVALRAIMGLLAASNGLGLIISLFFPETKGLSLEETSGEKVENAIDPSQPELTPPPRDSTPSNESKPVTLSPTTLNYYAAAKVDTSGGTNTKATSSHVLVASGRERKSLSSECNMAMDKPTAMIATMDKLFASVREGSWQTASPPSSNRSSIDLPNRTARTSIDPRTASAKVATDTDINFAHHSSVSPPPL